MIQCLYMSLELSHTLTSFNSNVYLSNAQKRYHEKSSNSLCRPAESRIKSNIPVNKRNRKKKKRGRPIKIDQEEYKKKSIVERFFSWIESCKKVFPRYEIKETSYLGVVMVAAIIRVNELLDRLKV